MKRLLAVVLVVVMAISICACGTPTPGDSVRTYLDAFKAQDTETMATVYNGEMDLFDDYEEYGEAVYSKILDFDYTIKNEKIDGDKASVDVDITTYKMGDAFDAIAEDVVVLIFQAAFDAKSEDEITAEMSEMLAKEFQKLEKKEYKATCTINLTQKDGVWVIDTFEEESEFYRAVLGGLIEAIEDLEKAFDEM